MASHVVRCQTYIGIMVYNILFIEGHTKLFRARTNTVLMGLKPRNLLLARVKPRWGHWRCHSISVPLWLLDGWCSPRWPAGSDDVRLGEISGSKARGAEENRVTTRKKIFEGHQHYRLGSPPFIRYHWEEMQILPFGGIKRYREERRDTHELESI